MKVFRVHKEWLPMAGSRRATLIQYFEDSRYMGLHALLHNVLPLPLARSLAVGVMDVNVLDGRRERTAWNSLGRLQNSPPISYHGSHRK